MKLTVIPTTMILCIGATAVYAGTTCESVRTDLTGTNLYGRHTMLQLSQDTTAGNCDAAAYLSRRAKDAQGFVESHCPTETGLRDMAARLVALARNTLQTPECQD